MARQSPQGSHDPPRSLWLDIAPHLDNRHDTANAKRVLYYCADQLVVVPPEQRDKRGTPTDVYAITPTGMLSWTETGSLITEAADRYLEGCERLLGGRGREYGLCKRHAAQMRDRKGHDAIWRMMTTAISDAVRAGHLPPEVVVKRRADIDADLTTIGTPGGVLDLTTGLILPYGEARKRLVVTSTPVEYDSCARHPLVDEILPPIGPALVGNDMAWYRMIILGFGLVHPPSREFLWEICAADSGKSTFINTLRQALGWDYIQVIPPQVLKLDPRRTASSHNGDLMRLGKPARFAFVLEFEGEIDSSIIKGASGGDDVTLRQIYLGGEVLDVTAHLWFTGNPKDEGGARLGITNDDENTRAILARAKVLHRETIPNPDRTVVKEQTAEPEFKRAALARLVEYTMACSKMRGFPPDLPSNVSLQEAQRQTEVADWQDDWLRNVIRPREPQDTMPEACATAVYEDLKQWWSRNGVSRPPAK